MEVTNFYNYGTMNEVEAGATQINNYYGTTGAEAAKGGSDIPTPERLADAVLKVQSLFWANSSYTVLFCVLRDCCGYPNNRSQYEREMELLPYSSTPAYRCTTGVVSSTINDNKYMEMPVEKWKELGAPARVLKLVDGFKTALEEAKQI